MADTTWTELIKHKINFLVDSSTLIETINSQKNTDFKKGIYGEGDAAKKIIRTVREYYNNECQS
jgi:UDP-N-acetylglucosamine 2-epimerase